MQDHAGPAGVLDAAEHQHLGPGGRHLQHLLVGDHVQLAGRAGHPRVGGVDAVHVGIDLADARPQRGGQRHRGGVRPAPAEGGHVPVGGDPLEAGDDHHVAGGQRLADPPGPHVQDARLAVQVVGDDARLGAGERLGRHPEVGDGHGEQRHGDALAGGEQHVHLARRRVWRDLPRQRDQVIGGVAHGGDHHHDLVAGVSGGDHALGDTPDPRRVPDRGAAVLLDDQGHGRSLGRRAAGGRVQPTKPPPAGG
jgi:2-polyprenyl-6-hydroxyphenyl methylase/3-demethylubiquinone-9 3-methyltransferase